MVVRQRRRHASPEHLSEQADARLDVAGETADGDGEAVAGQVRRGFLSEGGKSQTKQYLVADGV